MNDFTLMFYFAGDNALAPVIVSLLKEIKDAGFQENTDVLVYFDTNELGVPTRVFDVNRVRKRNPRLRNTIIGDDKDSFVRTVQEDDILRDKKRGRVGPALAAMRKALEDSDAINAEQALTKFLDFCRENHRAKHYMLFLVGHGMVVGNDAFLPDDNPVSAITLKKLGRILKRFTSKVENDRGALELLTLHSCSLSAVEVAYELKGAAGYMMASEGGSFVGSWPYRQLLKKIFNTAARAKRRTPKESGKRRRDNGGSSRPIDMEALIEDLYFHTVFNATDFHLAGYSHDLALCSLDRQKFPLVTKSIRKLVSELKKGLKPPTAKNGSAAIGRRKHIKELVLLAHLEAQSYWGETYTDLFDFCRCLVDKCNPNDELKNLREACLAVMENLDTIKSRMRSERFKGFVIHSRTLGSHSQYSHGLSVYFPWSRPIENETKRNGTGKGVREKYEDEDKGVLERYKEYAFTRALGVNSWLTFLESYFDETKRQSRAREDRRGVMSGQTAGLNASSGEKPSPLLGPGDEKPTPLLGPGDEKPTPLLGPGDEKPTPLLGKPSPLLGAGDEKPSPIVGGACGCASIKNYPEEEVFRDVRRKKRNRRGLRSSRKRSKRN